MNLSRRLAEPMLQALHNLYLTSADKLTPQELTIAKRVEHCSHCGHFWLRKTKKQPDRCPDCKNYRYDTPLLDKLEALEAANKATLSREPTPEPTTQEGE